MMKVMVMVMMVQGGGGGGRAIKAGFPHYKSVWRATTQHPLLSHSALSLCGNKKWTSNREERLKKKKKATKTTSENVMTGGCMENYVTDRGSAWCTVKCCSDKPLPCYRINMRYCLKRQWWRNAHWSAWGGFAELIFSMPSGDMWSFVRLQWCLRLSLKVLQHQRVAFSPRAFNEGGTDTTFFGESSRAQNLLFSAHWYRYRVLNKVITHYRITQIC